MIAFYLLDRFGRRLLLLTTMVCLTVILILLALAFDIFPVSRTTLVVVMVLFVLIFEFGPGPICWIYLAEVMNEKGVAVATSLIWTFTLIYSSLFPLCLNNPSVMYVLCAPCGFASLLIYF